MRAISYDRFGGLDVLHPGELPAPQPGANAVQVAVRASSVNVIDGRVRSGSMGPLVKKTFPKIPGADVAGVVTAVGPGVTAFKPGDAVFGAADPFKGGAFAETAVLPAAQLAPKPEALTFEAAAALPIAGLAALLALRDLGRVARGDAVLIHGASGGVGLFAVQLARHFGAHVTAVAGTGGIAAAQAMGADTVIDYRTQGGDTFDRAFDVILNASGKMPFAKGRRFLKPEGKLIEPSPTIPVFIGSKLANLFRRRKHLMLQTAARSADLAFLGGLAASGTLRITVAAVYPLAEARQAFAAQEKGGTVGKIVVTI